MGMRWGGGLAMLVAATAFGAPSFDDVSRTVFRPKCLECHGQPGPAADLDLSSRASILARGVVVPGEPDKSLLIEKVTSGEMPLAGDPLPESEIALLRDWITAGAPDAPPAEVATLRSITPAFGPTTGGTTVTLAGEHLEKTTTVTFGGQLCAPVTVVSATEVRCVTPPGALGSVEIRLVSEATTAVLENGYEYRLPLAPTYEALFANVLKPRCLKCHNDEKPSHGLSVESYASIRSHRRAVIPFDLKRSRIYKKTREGEMPQGGPRLATEEIRTIGRWIMAGAPER